MGRAGGQRNPGLYVTLESNKEICMYVCNREV
jgi:hypothetical protein